MRWSDLDLRVYLGRGEWDRVDPHTGTLRGTEPIDYYRYSGKGRLERVPWQDVYDAITERKERLERRFEKRYGNNAKMDVNPPCMTNNIFINRPCCHNSAPIAPSVPPAIPPRRCSTSSNSSTKTVYLTQEEVMMFQRYFNLQPQSGVDVDRLVNEEEYMNTILLRWNPLVHVRRSNLKRLKQKIQIKCKQRETKHSDSSDFEPNAYRTIITRKRESYKRKRDTDSDSEDIPLRKSKRLNKNDSESEVSIEKENLSLKEFAATLGLKENGVEESKSKENLRLTRGASTKHDEIESKRLIEYKRRMIERNKRRIREKMMSIRDNERVIKEKELFIKDNERSAKNNEKSSKSNENSTKENENTSKGNGNKSKLTTAKENKKSTRSSERFARNNEKSLNNNENSTKENEKSTRSSEKKDNQQSTKENEKSSKNDKKSSKDVGKSKNSEPKVLTEINSTTRRSEEARKKLKSRPLPPVQREYSPLEDHTIVSLVSVGDRSHRVSGNALWRDLETSYQRISLVPRTWQSLRNRYLRYILPNLGSLHLDQDVQSALRAGAARGAIKRKGTRASILHREEELPAASSRNRIPQKKSQNRLTIDYDQPSTSKGPTPRKSPRIDESSRKPPKAPEPPRKDPNASETARQRSDSSSPELITPQTRQTSIQKYLTRNSASNVAKPERDKTPRRRQLYNPRI